MEPLHLNYSSGAGVEGTKRPEETNRHHPHLAETAPYYLLGRHQAADPRMFEFHVNTDPL